MSELIFDEIERTAAYLKLNINAQEIADVMVKINIVMSMQKLYPDFYYI